MLFFSRALLLQGATQLVTAMSVVRPFQHNATKHSSFQKFFSCTQKPQIGIRAPLVKQLVFRSGVPDQCSGSACGNSLLEVAAAVLDAESLHDGPRDVPDVFLDAAETKT